MKRVLIAGATGYLGGHLVAEWKRRGYWVRVLVRRREQAAALEQVDSVFVGQLTDPATMDGVAEGVDTVISSIGITKPSGGLGYDQVDYGGNLTLLREAERSGVEHFGYVSVFDGERLRDGVRMVAAKERFVDALAASSIRSTVIRPTGFFSDMRAFADMAAKGRCYLLGDGTRRINPISGHDLAVVCADAMESGTSTLEVGGPQVFTYEDIAGLATEIAGTSWRVTRLPPWLLRGAVRTLRVVAPQRIWGPLEFLSAVMTTDMVAPAHGGDSLAVFLAGLARRLRTHEPWNATAWLRPRSNLYGMDYPELIDALRGAMLSDHRVTAAFLGGSRGRGDADEYSDVDVVVGADADDHAGLCSDMPTIVAAATDVVHGQRVGGLPVFTYITPDWLRFDVSISGPSELADRRLVVLFDRREPAATAETGTRSIDTAAKPDPEVVARLTREFLRVMGLLPVIVGRGEYALGVSGFGLLQGLLVQLLRHTTTEPDPGGVLSLRPLVTPDDYRALETLPAVEADRDSVVAGHLACARVFLPLARRLYHECRLDWPHPMVEALELHMRKTLDIKLPH